MSGERTIFPSTYSHSPIKCLLYSIAAQGLGYCVALLVSSQLSLPNYLNHLPMVAHILIAFFVAVSLQLPAVWQIFNLILMPSVQFASTLIVSPWIFSIILLILLGIYIPTFWTKVPYYPTSFQMYDVILNQLPTEKAFKFVDLGCGYGDLLLFLSKQRPLGEFIGIEIGPIPFLVAKFRALLTSKNIEIRFGDFWGLDLGNFDIIYAFLAPAPMPRLWAKVRKELQPGKIFLTNTFEVEAAAEKTVQVEDRHLCKLYVHRI